jgi:hypothetical protein
VQVAITLGLEQLEALGIEFPHAGESFDITAKAVVSHSSTSDPDADGDIDAACVVLELTELELDAHAGRAKRHAKKMYGKDTDADRDGGGTTGPFGTLNAIVGG